MRRRVTNLVGYQERVRASVRDHKFTYLLGSLCLLFILFPFLESMTFGRHLFSLLLALILLMSIVAVSDTRRILAIIVATGLPAIALNLAGYFDPSQVWFVGNQVFAVAFFLFTAFTLFVHILNRERVTHDEVFGAISVYLLIALAFGSLFLLADRVEPGSFVKTLNVTGAGRGVMTYSDYVYYSFGSITTAGTGEIVETGGFVRALTMLESVMGLFYVAFVISKLVSPVNRGS
ncbi:MAG TPA: potassium channel family protein [Methanomicrobiales archaeon]|nr:potassium channel family protein [Methanomicrobiales archaeon]